MISRVLIIEIARSYLGTPWRHQGRMPGKGMDCAGVITKTANEVGATDFDFLAYSPHSNYKVFIGYFRQHAVEIPKQIAQAGDIVIIPTGGTSHCGILGEKDGKLTLIHSYAIRRKVVEEEFTEEWRSRVVAAFQFPGVE